MRSPYSPFVPGTVVGVFSLVVFYMLTRELELLGLGDFSLSSYFLSMVPLVEMFYLLVPGFIAARLSRSASPTIGGLVGFLGAFAVWGLGVVFRPELRYVDASAFWYHLIDACAWAASNFAGAAVALWIAQRQMPSNQPLHPDALTRAGERQR